jgi:hypothetical protein
VKKFDGVVSFDHCANYRLFAAASVAIWLIALIIDPAKLPQL